MLRSFVAENRETILTQARTRVLARNGPPVTDLDPDRTRGLPVFLDELGEALRKASAREVLDHTEIQGSAHQHGRDLFRQGLTVDQVVHDYGDLCQVITALAVDQSIEIDVAEFRTLNLCLDDAIAGAVTSYSKEHDRGVSDEGTERLGVLAHEMRNVLNGAMLSFGIIKKGIVAPSGSTSAIVDRSFLRLQGLIDRSLAEVRLEAGAHNKERIAVREILEEVKIGAALVAQTQGLTLDVSTVGHAVIVEGDRPILAAAVANLLQNALKFTAPGTTVKLRARTTPTRVLIEVEDECGGLPPGKAEDLFRPWQQRGADRSGVGLGLSIARKAAESNGGELHVRDLPGKGCVFTLDLPTIAPPPLAVVDGGKTNAPSPVVPELPRSPKDNAR
jgi:signal transduction histidine kinase